jgi:ribose 5-phosphate isomerase B
MGADGKKKVFVGSDHAGFGLKEKLSSLLRPFFPDLDFVDCGCFNEKSVDYPDIARDLVDKINTAGREECRGILICGSGVGVCITANKFAGIRAAQIWDATSARLSREHNDANICCLGARLLGSEVAWESVRIWLTTDFLGGRHQRRLDLISSIERDL